MKLASMFFTASAAFLRFDIEDTIKKLNKNASLVVFRTIHLLYTILLVSGKFLFCLCFKEGEGSRVVWFIVVR